MFGMTRLTVSALALGAALGGCALGPDFRKPDNPMAAAQIPARTQPVAGDLRPAAVPADWWKLFNDPVLTSLEARAARQNLDLQMAGAQLAASRAQLGISDAGLMPQIGVGGGYSRGALSANGQYAALGAPSTDHNYWQTAFDASWEIDFWGHARRQQEGAAASAEASLQDRDAARVSIAAEVARNYLLLRGLQTSLNIVNQNLDIARDTLRLAESRQRNGVGTRFDTASAQSQISSTEALAAQVEHQRNQAMNALALLLGSAPGTLDRELTQAMPVPRMPRQLPVGVPSELARRRPDILQAEAQLHAATAAIGAAEADFYPRISLGGALGVQAFDSSDIADWSSRQFSIGPTFYIPIFEGGRLKGQLALTEARQQAAAIAYRQTVLTAWHEADNAIDAYATGLRRHGLLDDAYQQNREAFRVAQRSYQEGSADYLSVLVAQRNLLASQSELADGTTATALSLVALYKSLAGGWDPNAATAPAKPRSAAAKTAAAPKGTGQ